ncbi:MAG: hypothetical protein IT579_05055 [Verrucomicrobia subdivision 3 bacterium]|nr:hypothetical protein [Verrucomicrobiota bacterium]MCC6820082.1 hypothetical protein [Limisphaerales bacterium]
MPHHQNPIAPDSDRPGPAVQHKNKSLNINALCPAKKQPAEHQEFGGLIGEIASLRHQHFYEMLRWFTRTTY